MFNLPNPGNNPANPFYSRIVAEQQRALQEAVTVELDFKKDADGKKAGGKMVRKGVYKMTFKNNAEMNKFMDTNADKLNEEKEMDPSGHVRRSKRNPDMFCVFNKDGEEVKLFKDKSDAIEYAKKNHDALMDHVEIDEAEVYKRPAKVSALGGQKFHAIVANNKIVAAGMTEKEARKMRKFGQTVLELPGAKVGQMMREDVEQVDEMSAKQHYNKMVAQGKVGRGGRVVTPIDRDRFPNREKEGLEGPFRSKKSGQVYYYDKKAGKYYDPLSDMFLQVKDVMETNVIDNIDDYLAEGSD